jgi:cytochrome oxidase Cu insertion factor (SCO1/SenC/PrrC family)
MISMTRCLCCWSAIKITMDHSASFYLMGPDGRFISKLAYGIDAETPARGLSEKLR